MKTLTTLTAVVALFAGVAVANAQSSSGMSKSNGSMGSSSSSMGSQRSAAGNGKYCLQPTGSSSSMDCKFASMAACQKEAKAKNGNCIPNSKSGTTGMK